MSPKNLWGKLPDSSDVKPPITILREQATALKSATNGVLLGDVRALTAGGNFRAVLYVVAPALNNYRLEILEIEHPVSFYPISISSYGMQPLRAYDEQEFLTCLARDDHRQQRL